MKKNKNKLYHYTIVLGIITTIYQLLLPHHVFAADFNYWKIATSSEILIFKIQEPLNSSINADNTNKKNNKTDFNDEVINETELNSQNYKEKMRSWVLKEIEKAGLNPQEADAIINCESRWDDKAINYNRNGSNDKGLWQINSIHKNISDAERLDYKSATKWAIKKRLNDGNWSAWYCAKKLAIK